MDGRSLYTPLFAGVYWEVQDTFLEDIDRIEVIRGPGGTLWGANAVNGVINILTKSARDTQGGIVTAGGGSFDRGFGGFRYGGTAGEKTHFRIYGKYFDRDSGVSPGIPDFDDWSMGRVGFRSDTELPRGDSFTIQGDLYDGRSGQRTLVTTGFSPPFTEIRTRDADLSGGNLLGRWKHPTGEGSELELQAYFDQTFRREPTFREQRETWDLDLQHRFPLFWGQEVVWGLGYRILSDRTGAVSTLGFSPADRDQQLFTAFLQDELWLVPQSLRLTLGTKLEHNDYSGLELQPSGRLSWIPAPAHVFWASFTRAVRTPSRVERDLFADVFVEPQGPTFLRLLGSSSFGPEKVFAHELGYRTEPFGSVLVDVAAFYNRHEDYLSLEPGAPFRESGPPERVIVPGIIGNGLSGESWGAEVQAEVRPTDWIRLRGSYAFLDIDFRRKPGSGDASQIPATEGSSPHHTAAVRATMDLPRDTGLDVSLRYVDNLPAQQVDSYLTVDARLGWQASKNLEVHLAGRNLVESRHREFGGGGAGFVEVPRSVHGGATWRW